MTATISKPALVETVVMVPSTTLGLPVNPSNPLSAGLVSLLALSEGSGDLFLDSVTGVQYKCVPLFETAAETPAPNWFVPPVTADYPWPNSPAISNNAGRALCIQSDDATVNLIPVNTTGYSYGVLMQPLDNTTFGRAMDATGRGVLNIYTNVTTRQGLGAFSTSWRNFNDDAIDPYVPFLLGVGKWHLIVCTVQDGAGCMYINGHLEYADTAVHLANCVKDQSGQLVYNSSGQGQNTPNASFGSFYCWNNRVLTAAEVASLYASPWQMVE